jgi:hypothetical protein
MYCLAHLLNLVVKEVFEEEVISPILAKCRRLVGTFKHSSSLSEKLADTLRKEANLFFDDEINQSNIDKVLVEINSETNLTKKKNLRLKLVQDMATRWNSTLAMLVSVCDAHAAIRMVISQDENLKKRYSNELLNENELNVFEDLIRLLQPFKELTILISASDYVTSSIVLPAITRLMECMQVFESSFKLDFIENLAIKMHDCLVERTKPYFSNKILLTASFMDPRYRSLSYIKDQTERDRAMFDAISHVKSFYKNQVSNKSYTNIAEQQVKKKKVDVHLNFTLLCSEIIDSDEDDLMDIITDEIKRFKKHKVNITDSSCPLNFYKINHLIFPHMSKIAELVFCTTASSVPSECTFSAAGQLINKKRTRLDPFLAEDLLFLNRNNL